MQPGRPDRKSGRVTTKRGDILSSDHRELVRFLVGAGGHDRTPVLTAVPLGDGRQKVFTDGWLYVPETTRNAHGVGSVARAGLSALFDTLGVWGVEVMSDV